MADSVSFKVYLKHKDTEIRRFVVDKDVSTSFSFLQQKLCTLFPQLKQKIFSVSWTDEDGDLITIASDEELIIALGEQLGPVYKLVVNVKNKNTRKESLIHLDVTCDACNKQPIEGNRYKCVVCDDYDLCGLCEASGRHPGHNMIRIVNQENHFPRRLLKRIHKMQGRAERSQAKRRRKQRDSDDGQDGVTYPPHLGYSGYGLLHGFRMRRFGGITGMDGLSGGCGVGAWAGPAFDAMIRSWMEEQPMKNQGNQTENSGTTQEASILNSGNLNGDMNYTATAAGPPSSHPDAKIQDAIQAMMNMGFSNEGGRLASLLEGENGDIGKVLDMLQRMNINND